MVAGSLAGMIDGTGKEFASIASKSVNNTAGKVVTKVVVERAAAVPGIAGSQLIKKGDVCKDKTVSSTVGKGVAGVVKEVVKK